MKIRLVILFLVLCGSFAITSAFGQTGTNYVWTGNGGDMSLVNRTNWDPMGLPNGNNGSGYADPADGSLWDYATWDGRTSTNLVIQYSTVSLPSTGFGSSGINLQLTANQHNDVQIISPSGFSQFIGLNYLTNNSPASSFILGGTDTANPLQLAARPAGAVHYLVNNSTAPAIINTAVAWVAGGGNAYTLEFGGTGNWIVNHNLRNNNSGAGPITVILDGPGTMNWNSGGVWLASDRIGPVGVNGGTMVIQGVGLLPSTFGNNTITNEGTLVFDTGAADNVSRNILGTTGVLQVASGQITLSSPNSTYTGNTVLNGGELIVGAAEGSGNTNGPLGVGGTISFNGGSLGFTVNNTYDYSSRFDNSANQAYSIDTRGQDVTLAAGLTSSGGTFTKLGAGTLTLAGANSFSGLTTVSAGRLLITGTKTGTGNVTVGDGAILGVTGGSQITPAILTVGTSGSATLGFDNVSSTTVAPIAAGTISAAGPIKININSGTFTVGSDYPLIDWTSGSAPAVNLAVLNGYIGALSTNGNRIQVHISGTAYTWTGSSSAIWDTSALNWLQNGSAAAFANGGPVLFDDSSSVNDVTVNGVVQPTTVTVDNITNAYTITSSSGNDIGGSASLTKIGAGTLTLSGGANGYTGPTTVGGGTLSVGSLGNGGSASDIGAASSSADNLVIDGGTLQYTGSASSIDRMLTLGAAGTTLDASGSGALVFNATGDLGYSGNGPRSVTLTGTNTDGNTLSGNFIDNGGATTLAKSGVGKWVLAGTNTYSGGTTIAAGTLQVGTGGAAGAVGTGGVVNNGALDFNISSSLTVPAAISGNGSVTKDGSGTVILAANNSYSGFTMINAGTLQVGSGGGSGTLATGVNVTNNSTIIFNSSAAFSFDGAISGTGNLVKHGGGLLKLIGNNTYTGNTTIDSGAQLQIWQGFQGTFDGTGTITNNGTLILVRQDNGVAFLTNNITGTGKLVKDVNNPNNGDVTLVGKNSYTGGTFINGGDLILGDINTIGVGLITGNVTMTNYSVAAGNNSISRLIIQNAFSDPWTFNGNITGAGSLVHQGNDLVTLTGTNTYTGTTTIGSFLSLLQVGNGGTSGSIGTNNVSDSGTLIFNRSDDITFGGVITDGANGAGYLVKMGAGKLTLTASNSYTGDTTVSNGTLVVSGGNIGGSLGSLFLQGGKIAAAPAGTVGTLNIAGNMGIYSGAIQVTVNTSLAQSNSVYVSTLPFVQGSGAVEVVNAGPVLVVGQKFTLFNQAVSGGESLTVTGGGATWKNDLATDGSITVQTVTQVVPPTLTFTNSGSGSLQFNWSNSGGNFKLQAQTNSLTVGLSTNWGDYPAGGTPPVNVPINTTNGAVFFRLISTP